MKKTVLIIFVLSLFLMSACSTNTVIKYQCTDGSYVDNVAECPSRSCPECNCPELDYSNCPQQKCPDLDCSECPKQIETKTITKYQCYEGSITDRSNDCPKTEMQNVQDDCPELDMFKPKQNMWDENLFSVQFEEDKIYDGWKIQCGLTCSVNCRIGKNEGENINYYYCGKGTFDSFTLKKTITNEDGNILEVVTKDAVILYDKSFNYIETICES